jgi:hypothetical protein
MDAYIYFRKPVGFSQRKRSGEIHGHIPLFDRFKNHALRCVSENSIWRMTRRKNWRIRCPSQASDE